MSRWFLGIGPALILASCAVAFAQEAAPAVAGPNSVPGTDFLLSMGPYGALVWGAYLLGKGARLTVQIELSEHDRELIEKLARNEVR